MSAADSHLMSRVTLDQLLALNDEMAALVRAGIPLEQGLTALGQDTPGKLGVLATRLADRLRSGESLAEILQKDELAFPPVWRSVVLAGLRSGHLPAALEGLSQTVRRAADVRRSIAVSLIYPIVVVAIAFGFSDVLVDVSGAGPGEVLSRSGVPSRSRSERDRADWCLGAHLGTLGAHRVGPGVPRVVVPFRSGHSIADGVGTRSRPSRFLFGRTRPRRWPSVGQALRDGRMATFADLLRLMNDHQVPMPEAVVLAADASGDRALGRALGRLPNDWREARSCGGAVICRLSFRRCWAGRLFRGPGRRGWVGRCRRPPRCTDSGLRGRSAGRRCISPSC